MGADLSDVRRYLGELCEGGVVSSSEVYEILAHLAGLRLKSSTVFERSVQPGRVFWCDFGPKSGCVKGEIHKKRPVVVLSNQYDLCLVVAFSTVAPAVVKPWHHEFKGGVIRGLSGNFWLKGDLLQLVSRRRLDRVMVNGRYTDVELNTRTFAVVKECVRKALDV